MANIITQGIYKIRLDEVNNKHYLTASAAIGYLQEAAWKASVEWGVSINELKKNGLTWILSRLSIKIYEHPSYLDDINFETWISRYEKVISQRDIRFKKDEKVLFEAATQWLAMEIDTKKLIRLSENQIDNFLNTERTAFDFFKNKIPEGKTFEYIYKKQVRWHDLDINQHTNNKHYFRWALDALPFDVLNTKLMTDLDFQFKGETVFGDEITIMASEIENGFLHRIINQDGKEIIRGISHWE